MYVSSSRHSLVARNMCSRQPGTVNTAMFMTSSPAATSLERTVVFFGDALIILAIVGGVLQVTNSTLIPAVLAFSTTESVLLFILGILAIASGLLGVRATALFFKVIGLGSFALLLLSLLAFTLGFSVLGILHIHAQEIILYSSTLLVSIVSMARHEYFQLDMVSYNKIQEGSLWR